MNQLIQRIKGRTVAVVGNGPVTEDFSNAIDSADVVIRFNHFYNLETGLVGRKTDLVMQTFTSAWLQAKEKHADVFREQRPTVVIVKKPEQYSTTVHRFLGAETRVLNLARYFEPYAEYTTGGAFLVWLAANLGELAGTKIAVYGFPGGKAWEQYIAGPAKHYAYNAEKERKAVDAAILAIEAFSKAQTPAGAVTIPEKVVVAVKKVSTGLPGKNRLLFDRLMEKIAGTYDVVVVGDDEELLAKADGYGAEICALPMIGNLEDVTDTVRTWRAKTGYCGNVALVSCANPHLKTDWIDEALIALKTSPLAATATVFRKKVTALYRQADGVFVQAVRDLGPTSKARQLLPETVWVNGAVVAFHSDALDHKSFYEAGVLKPVVVEEKDAADIDTAEDLKEAGL